MILIHTTLGKKYWTEKYDKNSDGSIVFSTKSKKGEFFEHLLYPGAISEIVTCPDKDIDVEE